MTDDNTIEKGIGTRAEQIKHDLRQWLAKTVHRADTVSASIALLDIASTDT
jgi:hypothetical protein